ncbi:hypothetical protein GCM10010992_04870 [Cloacibacterium rupense]|uniref:GIY-YIG catalytic domain-containing protein n=1 Tax=Cloacibacterium rupense TaxID=517423 RepID=A0ABQ2NGN9_9FLAO|nr:hypothetical protein [Cloacibacterium rupense]GGP02048.1 hypothetical protein GCM10010992_04870 [Cloacibacterium rupense]
MLDEIVQSIKANAKGFNEHITYPDCPGIYAFFLNESSYLKEFGKPNQTLYVGIAKNSLKDRDFGNHFNSKSTGSSTLRRSIGAILKEEFSLIAFSRNGTNSKRELLNYKFNEEGERLLTDWMTANLIIGYWEDENSISYSELRDWEKKVIKFLKPTLDLDKRTRNYNIFADKLDGLRQICRAEAESILKLKND